MAIPRARKPTNPNELRDHLANERTLLAWIRTSVAMMGMGFVVAKFSLLLHEIATQRVHHTTELAGNIVGISLVASGCLTAAFAIVNFDRVRRGIVQGEVKFSPFLALIVAVVIAVVSLFFTIYLVLTV